MMLSEPDRAPIVESLKPPDLSMDEQYAYSQSVPVPKLSFYEKFMLIEAFEPDPVLVTRCCR